MLSLALATLAATGTVTPHDGDLKLQDKRPALMARAWRNRASSLPGAPLPVTAPAQAFPSTGVTLLSWLPLPEFGIGTTGNGNSCWGYVSPSGREYALFGHSLGTSFVEITQPGDAQLVATITGPTSLWRDMKVYSHYAYAVSEGGGGIQVMDLANIDSGVVTLVGTVNDDATGSTHTLAVDPVSGYLYRSGGGSNGLRMYDVHTNPAVPARVGTWSDRYVHEPSIFTYTSGPAAGKQIAYCCGGLGGGYTSTGLYVVDVTIKAAPTLLKYVPYNGSWFSHQGWISDDRNWFYVDDELDDRNLGTTSVTRVFNVSDPANASYVGTFSNGNEAIDHNQYVRGDKIYQSNYRSGLRVFQTTGAGTPTAPVEVAHFDTWPEDDETYFNGLWGNYPFFPSGVVIGSDMEKGLFVWWVGTPQLSFSIAGGLPATIAPAGEVLRVAIAGSVQPGTVFLSYDAGAGLVSTPLVQAANGEWLAPLPPAACGTPIEWFLSAQSTNGIVWSDPPGAPEQRHRSAASFARTDFVPLADFEASAQGFTAGVGNDTATNGLWVRANPVPTDLAPENDHSPVGTQCFVTGQGSAGGSVSAADVDNGVTTLLSPAYALAGQPTARISYWRWFKNQVPNGATPDDAFKVDVSNDNGTNWVNVETVGPTGVGTRGGWLLKEFRVADFVAPTNQVRVRFQASDTGNDTHVEAGIDDVRVTLDSCTGYETFCVGDASGLPCPCGNNGASGAGCANSFGTSGLLSASGVASIGADTLSLNGSGMSLTGLTLYFQGSAPDNGGVGTWIADGVRCVAGSIVRLGTKTNVGGASSYPVGADQTVSVRGGVTAGQTRYYQAYYRNAAPAFCPPGTANYTNGVAVVWAP